MQSFLNSPIIGQFFKRSARLLYWHWYYLRLLSILLLCNVMLFSSSYRFTATACVTWCNHVCDLSLLIYSWVHNTQFSYLKSRKSRELLFFALWMILRIAQYVDYFLLFYLYVKESICILRTNINYGYKCVSPYNAAFEVEKNDICIHSLSIAWPQLRSTYL